MSAAPATYSPIQSVALGVKMLAQAAVSDWPAVTLEGAAERVAGGGAVMSRPLLVARRV